MKVKDIQVDGFGVWTGLSVDSLPEGMTLFYGPNEAGKTTLMQFLRAMLYGFTESRRERYLPPLHGGSPGGAIRVTGPGGGYEIRRHNQLTDAGTNGRLTVTGQDGLVQGQHRLTTLLGQIDEPIFTNVFAIGIRELQELSTLDDTAAADELYKLSSGLDRVSLVDVMRSLRAGREDLVGRPSSEVEADASKLASLIDQRERLRDEIDQLTRLGRRWSELATLRRTQEQEIEQLTERVAGWEKEARCVETASSVLDRWTERETLKRNIAETETQGQIPDEAPNQLVQIEGLIEDRTAKVEEVKQKRREIRDKADQLPVSRRMFDLKGRIEAATEQATWVEALEEQVGRLDQQIEKAQQQLDADAQQLGLDEDERVALADGDTDKLPDLSRQSLATLADPAKRVKEQLFLLKQSRTAAAEYKQKADKLGEELRETLQRARATNLQQAIREENALVASLRQRIQLGEHLEKLKRHYRDLEQESADLATDKVLPIDRLPMLGIPFIFGGGLVLYGIFHLFGIETFIGEDNDPTQGMLCVIFGAMALLVYYLSRERGQRSTSVDLDDCERQIDSVRRQLRELESEREQLESSLPTSSQTLEQRLRDSEKLLAELEAALPVYHQHQAATQSYQAARKRASDAAERLKEARRSWSAALGQLGLSESMSPASVRNLGDDYETLQASLRRLKELQEEREQRSRERQTIAKRIETLYLEALELNQERTGSGDNPQATAHGDTSDHRLTISEQPTHASHAGHASLPRPRTGPLDQLNHLHEELSRQQHWIKRRRELKEQDQQLKKHQSAHSRAIERAEQQRRALWAKCGVATADQFYALVDTKASLADMRSKLTELDQQVRSMIGQHVDYDAVAREIGDSDANDLEKRWESLTGRISETETRIASLRTAQGELAQEMKQLADDRRLTTARLELGCVERQLESLARRWQILGMASCLLEDVCSTFERERQPETLREASSFLSQLTDGKYTRIWTPLGTNRLKIDDADGESLPLEVLSRGTGEAVFIALRLALASAYARRGVMLPLILDDVLVNFDRERATHAAATLKTFAELGHQVMMFTCHDHIVEIFQEIGIEVRELPAQGQPGRAEVLPTDAASDETPAELDPVAVEPVVPEPTEAEDGDDQAAAVDVMDEPDEEREPEAVPESVAKPPVAKPIVYLPRTLARKSPPGPAEVAPVVNPPKPAPRPFVPRPEPQQPERPAPAIGWAWYEREPADGRIDEDEIAAETARGEWLGEDNADLINTIPDDQVNRKGSWWNGNRVSA